MPEPYAGFGAFLREMRQRQGLSLYQLSFRLEITAPYIHDLESGRRKPPTDEKLDKFAEVLQLTPAEVQTMHNLIAHDRDEVALDVQPYIKSRDSVTAALRVARDLGADDSDWQRFVEDLKRRKG